MSGKLIVVDGLDGSGKSTQTDRLAARMQETGHAVKLISFPDYAEPSSALVKMYLNGELSDDPSAINAYAASSFYAVDRYASYQRHWKDTYLSGGIVLASRYVTSNMIHQMVKLPRSEWSGFIDWLKDYEYNKLQLPQPNKVIFLDMPRDVADRLLLKRYAGDREKEDIHERNKTYLVQCREAALYAAEAEDWSIVRCAQDDEPLPVEEISEKLWQEILPVLEQ